ncbi:MAG: hypothetical protein VCF25_04040 [Candidatus Poribacteria bacterium]
MRRETWTGAVDAGLLRLPRSRRYLGHPFGHAWNQEGELARQSDYRIR